MELRRDRSVTDRLTATLGCPCGSRQVSEGDDSSRNTSICYVVHANHCLSDRKTEAEKFAGGYWTSTCEAYIPTNGRGIQGATSQ